MSSFFSRHLHPAVFCVLLLLLLQAALFIPAHAGPMEKTGNAAAENDPASVIMNMLSGLGSFGGEGLGAIQRELTNSYRLLQKGIELAKSLNNKTAFRAINFFIRTLVASVSKAAESLSKLPSEASLTPEDVDALLTEYKVTVVNTLDADKTFPKEFTTMFNKYFNSLIPVCVLSYRSIERTFALKPSYVLVGSMLLKSFEHDEYLDRETFETLLSVPDQMNSHLNGLLSGFMKGGKMDMMGAIMKMMTQQQAQTDQRENREEL
jgi:hypothetical protein